MKTGDIVRLKGYTFPIMTVRWVREGVNHPLAVTCEWFDINLHLQQHEFKLETLEEIP